VHVTFTGHLEDCGNVSIINIGTHQLDYTVS